MKALQKLMCKGLRVRFSSAGVDPVGRFLAAGLTAAPEKAAPTARVAAATAGEVKAEVKAEGAQPEVARTAEVAAPEKAKRAKLEPPGPDTAEPQAVALTAVRELVHLAWARLSNQATVPEIVNAVLSTKKLKAKLEQQSAALVETSWETLVLRILKEDGTWSGEKRAWDETCKPSRVYVLRQPDT